MDQPGKSSPHPVVLIAAVAVTLLSLTGVAAIMGWLPTSKSNTDVPSPLATASAPAATASAVAHLPPNASAPTGNPVAGERTTTHSRSHHTNPTSEASTTTAPGDTGTTTEPQQVAVAHCSDCGVVESIHTVTHKGEGTGIGAVGGAVVGGVLGNQIGEGTGKRIARIGGAVLGGFAGNEVEKRARSETSYEISVRMDDGSIRTVSQKSAPSWQQGQRVRVDNGVIYSADS